jgi:hypothetical protein
MLTLGCLGGFTSLPFITVAATAAELMPNTTTNTIKVQKICYHFETIGVKDRSANCCATDSVAGDL